MQDSGLVVRVLDITTEAHASIHPAVFIANDVGIACGAAVGVSLGVLGSPLTGSQGVTKPLLALLPSKHLGCLLVDLPGTPEVPP